jgi:AbrB family looped-hinge helix DNA binding protein
VAFCKAFVMATITSKGQITIPAEIRASFDLKPGDQLVFFTSLTGDLAVRVARPRRGAGRGKLRELGVAEHAIELSRAAIGDAAAEVSTVRSNARATRTIRRPG